jgi:hypothetical protein
LCNVAAKSADDAEMFSAASVRRFVVSAAAVSLNPISTLPSLIAAFAHEVPRQ